jgi:hypothetical protein
MSTWTAVVAHGILLEQRQPELLEAFHIHGAAEKVLNRQKIWSTFLRP